MFRRHRGTLADWLFFKKRGAETLHVFYAVIQRASEEMAEEDIYEIAGEELTGLPVREEHDDDFTTASMMLVLGRV